MEIFYTYGDKPKFSLMKWIERNMEKIFAVVGVFTFISLCFVFCNAVAWWADNLGSY